MCVYIPRQVAFRCLLVLVFATVNMPLTIFPAEVSSVTAQMLHTDTVTKNGGSIATQRCSLAIRPA